MFNLSQFFTARYLFDNTPHTDFLLAWVLLFFFAVLLFLPSIFREAAKHNRLLRKSAKKRLWKFPYLGAIGIVLVLARIGDVPVFSMRALLYGLVVFIFVVAAMTGKTIYQQYQKRTQSAARKK